MLLIGSTAAGTLGTILFGAGPGALLGVFLVAGSLAAAFAVDLRAVYLLIPVPALAYLVAAIVAGLIHDHRADISHTALLVNTAQWLAAGFLYLVAATVAVIATGIGRWLVRWRRTYRPRSRLQR